MRKGKIAKKSAYEHVAIRACNVADCRTRRGLNSTTLPRIVAWNCSIRCRYDNPLESERAIQSMSVTKSELPEATRSAAKKKTSTKVNLAVCIRASLLTYTHLVLPRNGHAARVEFAVERVVCRVQIDALYSGKLLDIQHVLGVHCVRLRKFKSR